MHCLFWFSSSNCRINLLINWELNPERVLGFEVSAEFCWRSESWRRKVSFCVQYSSWPLGTPNSTLLPWKTCGDQQAEEGLAAVGPTQPASPCPPGTEERADALGAGNGKGRKEPRVQADGTAGRSGRGGSAQRGLGVLTPPEVAPAPRRRGCASSWCFSQQRLRQRWGRLHQEGSWKPGAPRETGRGHEWKRQHASARQGIRLTVGLVFSVVTFLYWKEYK